MDTILGGIGLILIVFWMVVLLKFYHSNFGVIYTNLVSQLFGELIVAFFLAYLLTLFTVEYWWIALIIGVLIFIGSSKK